MLTDLWSALEPYVIETLAGVAVGVLGLAYAKFSAWANAQMQQTGIVIEEKHRKALHSAVLSGLDAYRRGGVAGLREYAAQSIPDAMTALNPTDQILDALAQRYEGAAK